MRRDGGKFGRARHGGLGPGGGVDREVSELERQLLLEPHDVAARVRLAAAYRRVARPQDAARVLFDGLGREVGARALRRELRSLGPTVARGPWPDPTGGEANTGAAPVRGARAGRVRELTRLPGVARAELGLTVCADGAVLVPTEAGLVRVTPGGGGAQLIAEGASPAMTRGGVSAASLDAGGWAWFSRGGSLCRVSEEGTRQAEVFRDDQALLGAPSLVRGRLVIPVQHWVRRTVMSSASVCALDEAGSPRWVWEPHDEDACPVRVPVRWRVAAAAKGGTALVMGLMGRADLCWRDYLVVLGVTGQLRWSYAGESSSGVATAPAVDSQGRIYAVLGQRLCALESSGQLRWASPAGRGVPSAPALSPEPLVHVHHDGHLLTLDSETGECLARCAVPGRWARPVVDAEGVVYACAVAGTLCAFAPDGTPLFRVPAPEEVGRGEQGSVLCSVPAMGLYGTTVYASGEYLIQVE